MIGLIPKGGAVGGFARVCSTHKLESIDSRSGTSIDKGGFGRIAPSACRTSKYRIGGHSAGKFSSVAQRVLSALSQNFASSEHIIRTTTMRTRSPCSTILSTHSLLAAAPHSGDGSAPQHPFQWPGDGISLTFCRSSAHGVDKPHDERFAVGEEVQSLDDEAAQQSLVQGRQNMPVPKNDELVRNRIVRIASERVKIVSQVLLSGIQRWLRLVPWLNARRLDGSGISCEGRNRAYHRSRTGENCAGT